MKWGGSHVVCVAVAVLFLTSCMGARSSAPVSVRGAAPVKQPAVSSSHRRGSSYRVKKGDTLYSIAWQYGHDYKTLATWNGIKAPFRLSIGQRVSLKKPVNRAGKKQYEKGVTNRAKKTQKTPGKTAKKYRPAPRKEYTGTAKLTWKWPVNGKLLQKFSAGQRGRKGVDIGGRVGQPVNAASTGRVVYSGSGLIGYGKLIILKHNNRFLSAYAHNNKIFVKEGETVKQGQRIAEMGKSSANKAMLHFEIRRNGKPVNPLRYLPKRRS